jgi:hypothetical protein
MAVRYLGLILPVVVTYWFSQELDSRLGFTRWTLVMVSLGTAIWITATATLIVRHDRNGAAAIGVIYVLVDAWWWTIALGVVHFD